MTDYQQQLLQLNQLLEEQIPQTTHQGIIAESYTGTELVLTAPLLPNSNDKNTAFAGSIYSIATLCGWCLLTLTLYDFESKTEIAVYDANIKYLKPVLSDYMAVSTLPEYSVVQKTRQMLQKKGKAKIELLTTVRANNELVAEFTGKYSIKVLL